MKKGFQYVLLIVISCFISFALFSLVILCQAMQNDRKNVIYDQGNVYFRVQYEANPLELPDDSGTIEYFDKCIERLSNIDFSAYYILNLQPLYFSPPHLNPFDAPTAERSTDYEEAMCIQISENVQADFHFEAQDGRVFTASDFLIDSWADAIPVILGND